MAFIKNVAIGDGRNLDAFNRLRVSDPESLFDSQFQYNLQPLLWEHIAVSSGTVAHAPNTASATLTVPVTNGALSALQTKSYFRYYPGRSQMIAMTFVLGAAVANVRRRVGYFDANDGVFLEQNGTVDVALTLRTSTSGSPSDTSRVLQANWNIDPMTGSGPSKKTLNLANIQILIIDAQWLGAGRVRVGFDIDGVIYYVHEFKHANILTVPYCKTFNLPCRYEIANTNTSAGASMTAICANVSSEGGAADDALGIPNAVCNLADVTVSTRRAILSVRPATTFNAIANRIRNILESVTLYADASATFELVYNPTFTGTPTWTAVDAAASGMEYSIHGDAANGAFTGGLVTGISILGVSGGVAVDSISHNISSKLPWALNAAGTVGEAFSIVATSFSGSIACRAGMHWMELR